MIFEKLLTVTLALFAVIDIIGVVPILISLKEKMGGRIRELSVVVISGTLMLVFLLVGDKFLKLLGLDTRSFAVGGSIVIFIMGLEMVVGRDIFKSEVDDSAGIFVPIAFPLIAGSGTLTTIISLRANYDTSYIAMAILINLIVVYIVLKSLHWIQRALGEAGMKAIHKFFGIIVLAIAVKIFTSNIAVLIQNALHEIR